ncbi:MAG: hypothetical protein NTV62_00060 [Candidatus Gribaldobacteria bacterium]|nr:hypothetical protein [Candidatus Gribaldobacteria bacterium]
MINDSIIRIIPKSKARPSFKVNFLVFASGILLIFCAGVFLFLTYFLNPTWSHKKIELQNTLAGLDSQSNFDLKNSITATAEKISDFSALWTKHKSSSQIFDFLKTICHKRVKFESVNLGTENNITTLFLSATTDSFKTLGEQLLSLRSNPLILSLNVSEIALSEKGVSFGITMGLADTVLKSSVR